MARRSDGDWQSFPIEFRSNFPSLEDSTAAAQNKKKRGGRVPNAVLNLRPHEVKQVNAWENRSPRPSVPEWSEDDVHAANNCREDTLFSSVVVPELVLQSVSPVFTDRLLAVSRYNSTGYELLVHTMMTEIKKREYDPSSRYRSTSITIDERQDRKDGWLQNVPHPAATPKWINSLPDSILNEEFKLLCFLRPLNVSIGPHTLEEIKRRCPYASIDNRRLPIYKADITVTPMKKPEKKKKQSGLLPAPWNRPSNDARMSESSASSSQHGVSSHNGRHIKAHEPIEFWNSKYSHKSHNKGYGNMTWEQPRSNESEYGWKRNGYNRNAVDQGWDAGYTYPASQNNRRHGYNRNNENYRSDSRSDCDYREDSGYQEDSHCVYEEEVEDACDLSTLSTLSDPPFEVIQTRLSRKTPVWRIDDEVEESSREKREPRNWTGRRIAEKPVFVEKSKNETRDGDPDVREYWRNADVPIGIRRVFRCLEGIPASSCAAFGDDLHRVEILAWSGETDTAEVTARMKEKYGIEEMERKSSERRVKLALPRTTITLSVGAGGEADILFEGELTDVLVRGQGIDDIKDVILETIVKSHDFISHHPTTHVSIPSTSKNTVITFGSTEESREVRQRLSDNDIEAKKIPRDLIIGNWDGSYAKRECLLELEWERKGTNGYMVFFNRLEEQNNVVDRLMREKSDYFMNAHCNIEEANNRMYVSVPASPYSVEDDLKFLKKLLDENKIYFTGIQAKTYKDGPQRIDSKQKQINCTFAINRRMLKVAIEEGVWGGFHPRTVAEWQMMLDGGRFSWVVEMHDERMLEKNGINSATVHFDSYEQGERIAAQAQRMTPNTIGDDRFILNKDDKKGVFARAKLRVHYNVPVLVHALTLHRLKRMDEKWRQNSYFNHADFQTEQEPFIAWTCLITDCTETTPPGFARLIVEGFPRSAVEDSCAELLRVLRGDVIKCEGDESWLLTGIGRTMANAVANEVLEKHNVLVDFNVLGKEIRLIGEEFNTTDVAERLKKIAKKREAHVMETVITVSQPVYMNRASIAIECCGGLQMLEKVIGECKVTISPDDPDQRSLAFVGTVRAYDRLRDFLGELDDTLRHSAKKEYDKQRKTNARLEDSSLSPLSSPLLCPICSCRPSTDFYRLEACGHVYCTPCIYHQLHSELSTRTLPLSCRRAGCDRKLAISDILRLLLGRDPEEKMEAASVEHLDEFKLRPLVTAIVTNALQTQRDRLIACRTADCAGIFPRQDDPNAIVRCKTCERTTCGACGYEPHRGYTCEEYEGLRDNVDESIASYMKNKKVRKCPNESCSAVIEKTVGCNHMECVICRTHFCWLCGHASRTQGEIYAHMQNDHGGNGLHMDDGEMFMLQFD